MKTSTTSTLLKIIRDLNEKEQKYKTVVIIGHSNKHGLKLTSDDFVKWDAVAKWLTGFEPKKIIFLACEAGQELSYSALFTGIDSLGEISGSPLPVKKDQRHVILGKIVHILYAKKENSQLNIIMQGLNLIFTQGIIITRTRKDFMNGWL